MPVLRSADGSHESTILDGDGYILLYKRLSNVKFQWLRSEVELKLLDSQSFRWLLEGLCIEQETAIPKGKPMDLF